MVMLENQLSMNKKEFILQRGSTKPWTMFPMRFLASTLAMWAVYSKWRMTPTTHSACRKAKVFDATLCRFHRHVLDEGEPALMFNHCFINQKLSLDVEVMQKTVGHEKA